MSTFRLPRAFYRRDPLVVAPDLLNKVLVHDGRAARIVEVEAYRGEDDPASHAFRGETPRTRVMLGRGGHLYVYFTYGMHWCANAVCGDPGSAGAVLLRAGAPLEGTDEMFAARPVARRPRDLCSGPAKLCQAFGIDGSFDGADLTTADRAVAIVDDGTAPPETPGVSTRTGVNAGGEEPWRWFVVGDPNVSPHRPYRAPVRGRGSDPVA